MINPSDYTYFIHRKYLTKQELIAIQNINTKLFLSRPHISKEVGTAAHFRPHESIDITTHSYIWRIFRNGYRDPTTFYADENGHLCVGRVDGVMPLSFRLLPIPEKDVLPEWKEDRLKWQKKQTKRNLRAKKNIHLSPKSENDTFE
jgi:hypothetical protein